MTDGSAGLDFMDDIIRLLNDNWKPSIGGVKPEIKKIWEEKVVGMMDGNYRAILVNLDTEAIKIFSLMSSPDVNGNPTWDWIHDLSVTIDVRAGENEKSVLEMVNMVVKILKNNVLLNINGRAYVQLLPGNAVSNNEEYRNLYRYIIDCDAMIYNP